MQANPLLDTTGLPRYAAIRPEHIEPAIDAILADNRAVIARITTAPTPASWSSVIEPLENANERLARAWGAVSHLHGVLDSPALREAYNATQPKIVAYYTELGQNLALFEKYKALAAAPEFARRSAVERRIVEHEIRDFRLAGAELPEDRKKRFAELQAEQASLGTKFSENLLDATNAFVLYVSDAQELRGVPDDVLAGMRAAAEADGQPGWKITLQMPTYLPVMQYCENRALRERLYRAHATRASEFGPEKLDNTPLMRRILQVRKELANLLGYASPAEVSLVPKMADTPAQVLGFLDDLAAKAKPFAERDMRELREFAARELNLPDAQSWDLPFASEKLRVARYAFSDQEVKQYFPEPQVLAGLFRLIETLYGLVIAEAKAEVWDPTVRFFEIRDKAGALVGQFFLDLYARETKRGGAWMDEVVARRRTPGGTQVPVAHLICNFARPVGDRPALLTHDDVITLFHECGHGLHHLLTKVDHLWVAGIHGVEWDAVELPSQFMENFCWEWDVLAHMTAHVDTGAPLPRALFDKMIAAKNFQSGMQMVRQLEFSLFDMHLHFDYDPEGSRTPQQVLDAIRARVAVAIPPAYNRFPQSFGHIFAGGYAAGYYSYKWAEVLSADAYSLFEERGVLDPSTGKRFWDEILAVGGSRPAIESFRAFRGRDPQVDALLRHNGMVGAPA